MILIMSRPLVDALSKLTEREQEFAAGKVLFRVGDRILALYVVVPGALHLTRALPHGAQLMLQRAGPDAILAEASLFATKYHCDATNAASGA